MDKIDISLLTVLENGVLKTTGAPYQIVLLDDCHTRSIKALHDKVIDGLPADEKNFMLRKDFDYFTAHFARGHGNAFLGIVSGGVLIGQAMILHPNAQHPDTGMVDMAPVGPPESVSVLQAVSVLPVCRGTGLMNRMVAHWLDYAQAHGREHALAEIEVHNTASWAAFLTGGLNLAGIGRDPADGTLVYNAHETVAAARAKRLSPVFNAAALACPVADVARQQEMMAAGYVATAWDRTNNALVMEKRNLGFTGGDVKQSC